MIWISRVLFFTLGNYFFVVSFLHVYTMEVSQGFTRNSIKLVLKSKERLTSRFFSSYLSFILNFQHEKIITGVQNIYNNVNKVMLITATFLSLSLSLLLKCHISTFLRRLKYIKAQNHNVSHFPTNIYVKQVFASIFFPFGLCECLFLCIPHFFFSFKKLERTAKRRNMVFLSTILCSIL